MEHGSPSQKMQPCCSAKTQKRERLREITCGFAEERFIIFQVENTERQWWAKKQKREQKVLCNLSQTCTHLHPHAPSITLKPLAPFLLNTRKTSAACGQYGSHSAPCKLYLTDPVVSRAGRAASRNAPLPAYSGRLQHPLPVPMNHPPLNIITSVLT